MAFDISTAKPVSEFDISTARPVQPEAEKRLSTFLPAPVAEAAGAINRGVAEIPDFFIGAANEAINAFRDSPESNLIPSAGGLLEQATGGTRNFMEPGIARDLVQAGGELVPAVAGVAAAGRKAANVVANKLTSDSAIAQTGAQIRTGETGAVKKTVSGGRVVADRAASDAIKQGFDEGTVSAVKASSKKTKAFMRRMVGTLERGLTNKRFAVQNRPADVVGNSVQRRITKISEVNNRAGKRLNVEAKKLSGQNADFSTARQQFIDDLAEMGITVGDDGKAVFQGSDIEDISGAERIIKTVLRRLDSVGDDALQGHRLKRFIDNNVSFGKTVEGLSGNAERVVKSLRRNIDQSLDAKFENYKKVNDTFGETRQVLDAFLEAAGGKLDVNAPNAEKQIGTLARRLMSNVQSRVRLLNSIEGLDEVAAKHGASVDDDILTLALFADELDTVFKPVARTSLGGELAKTAVTQGKSGVIQDLAGRGIDAARGVNEQNAIKAIKLLLR